MASNESNSVDSEDRYRKRQLRLAEEAIRGLLSNDFGNGNGEFIEPVRGIDPTNYQLPEDEQLIGYALSEIMVSADPGIDTTGQALPTAQALETVPTQAGIDEALAPRETPPGQSDPGVSIDPEPMAAQVAPGLSGLHSGRDVPRDATQRLSQAEAAVDQKRRQSERPAATPTVGGQMKVPAGSVVPEFGTQGDTFFQPPTAGDMAMMALAADAVDAVSNRDDMMLELLRRLSNGILRNGEMISQLIDKQETEDEEDEF